jgi:SWI/SNF-related matrix-associated actin-dependent regulator 1 of chromatin subfamily A
LLTEALWKLYTHTYNLNEFYIDEVNKTANFKFPFNSNLKGELRNCDRDARWNPELKEWIVPINNWTKTNILHIIKKYDFKKKVILTEDVDFSYKQNDVDYAYLRGMCDSKGFTYIPREYQLEALGYSLDKGSIINGDDVGLGKTFEAIMYAEVTNSFPCLVIVPASVKDQWKEKWFEITDGKRSISTINSSPTKKNPNNWDSDVIIINYDIIGKKQGTGTTVKFQELLDIKWKMAVSDEGHFLKEKKSQRSQAAKKIIFTKENLIVQLLTGTAVMSKPVEIWNLLVLIGKDNLIADDWHQFIRRYCGGYRGRFGWVTDGATNTIELNKKLRENCYIRREKRDVLSELPPITKQVLQVPISNKKDIDSATLDFIEYVKQTHGLEAADKAMEAEHLVQIGILRRLAINGKLKGIEQYLKDWKTSGNKKLVIFGIHKDPLQNLSEKFKCPLISGGVSSQKKHEIVKDWCKGDDIFLFANMDSAGTGVDGLQKVCSNMIIIELPWRPSDITQVVGRLDRSGQEEPTTVSFLLNDNTIDKEMWEMLELKERITESVNKGIDVKRNGSGMKAVIKKILKRAKKS